MTLTNRQVISDIIGDLRALNVDDRVSRRYILHKLHDFASLYIKRDSDIRRLFNISDIWTEVQCVELCEAPLIECCSIDIPTCKSVMKSKFKIPETYETLYKNLIQVLNPFFTKEFHQTDPQQYRNILNREFTDKRIKYFWFSNGYLVIPDAVVETVTLRGMFINPAEAKKLNSCSKEDNDNCVSILDQPFICPDYLLAVVKQETTKDLFNFYKRNILDEKPDINTNIKN